jgi:hypothetical protein
VPQTLGDTGLERPRDWPLLGYFAFGLLALVLKPLWASIYEEWLRNTVGQLGVPVTLIAENVPLLVVAGLIVIGIYRYLTREFERQLVEIVRPRIKLGDIKEHIEFPDGGTLDQQHLEVQNIGKGILRECLVTIDKVIWDDGATIEPRVSLATVARAREGKFGRFNLDGNLPKQLLLTSRDLSDVRNPGAHTLMGERYPIPLHRGKSGNVFLTAAASEGDPNRLVLRFSVDEKYVLTFTRAG